MNNIRQSIMLAVATAWFVQPSSADQITSIWTRNHFGSGSGSKSLEESLHARLKRQVYGHDRDLNDDDDQPFVGPGVMECNNAACTFEVDPSLGCADPCHTRYAPKRYEYAFFVFSTVDDPVYSDEDDLCHYKSATDIKTFSPELAVIEEGCTARCTGCTFASPIVPVSGPSVLECDDGRCTKYIHGEEFECGRAIEAASESFGSLSTLPDGEVVPHVFHGFEGINGRFEIPDTCNLECTGCTAYPIEGTTKTVPTSTSTTTTSTTSSTEPETTTTTTTTSTEEAETTTSATESTSTTTTSTEHEGTQWSSTEGTQWSSTEGTQWSSTEWSSRSRSNLRGSEDVRR